MPMTRLALLAAAAEDGQALAGDSLPVRGSGEFGLEGHPGVRLP